MSFSYISAYEQNIRNVDASSELSPSKGQVSAVKAANAAALGDAKEGQVVTGEVSQVNGRTVKLTLPDSQVVTARLEADVKLVPGESMAFAVKSNTGSQISLKPLFNSNAVNATAIKALSQASIIVDERALSMASAMMEENLPVGKASLQGMFRQINRFPDADPADIVAMSKQGLPLDADTVRQFSAYRHNEHQIMEMAEDMSGDISDMAGELGFDGALELADIFGGEGADEAAALLKGTLGERAHEFELSLIEQERQEQPKPAGILDVSLGGQASEEKAAQSAEETKPPLLPVESDSELGRILDGDTRLSLAQSLEKAGMPADGAERLINGEMSPKEAFDLLRGVMRLESEGIVDSLSLPDEDRDAVRSFVRQLPTSKAFKSLLKDAVIRDMTLENDGDISNEKVSRLYERIIKDTGSVSRLLDQFGKSDSALASSIDNVHQNISFMNQLNEAFTYVQLPIRMSEENAHGDLYVMTNKKKLAEKDGEVTALLHLEMDVMGTLDIHVSLKDENVVKTHFMLESEELLDFVEKNMHMLDERLTERGYNATTDAAIKDRDADRNPAVAAMLGGGNTQQKGRLISKYSFDVKA